MRNKKIFFPSFLGGCGGGEGCVRVGGGGEAAAVECVKLTQSLNE